MIDDIDYRYHSGSCSFPKSVLVLGTSRAKPTPFVSRNVHDNAVPWQANIGDVAGDAMLFQLLEISATILHKFSDQGFAAGSQYCIPPVLRL